MAKRDIVDFVPMLPEEMKVRLPIYQEAVSALKRAGIPFIVIGGIAMLEYGRRDITKDIDFFVTKEGAQAALPVFEERGFETRRTDEVWIYHAFKNGEECDLIFEIGRGFLAQKGIAFEPEMLARAHPGRLGKVIFPVASAEDLVLTKTVVSWKDLRQYDWQHVLQVIKHKPDLDWNYIYRRSNEFPARLLALLSYSASCQITEDALPGELKRSIEAESARMLERILGRRAA
ncbi:MAG: nucleotidyltransferase [Candidatus Aquicultorales bacterium]